MSARALASRIRDAATTDQPQPARQAAVARWIGRFCSVVLIGLAVVYMAAGTPLGHLVAVGSVLTGVWFWQHQHTMRGTQ